jgi:ABC-type multidrug transport system fused ATPase/permease subunit
LFPRIRRSTVLTRITLITSLTLISILILINSRSWHFPCTQCFHYSRSSRQKDSFFLTPVVNDEKLSDSKELLFNEAAHSSGSDVEPADPSISETTAVRLLSLTKVYKAKRLCCGSLRSCCCCYSPVSSVNTRDSVLDTSASAATTEAHSDDAASTKALSNLSISLYQSQISVILGHNGAGKSTLVSILTGLYSATSGQAQIFDLDVASQMNEIRKKLGVCPQHDILFDNLTVREHLHFFAAIKGVNAEVHSFSRLNLIFLLTSSITIHVHMM